MEERTDKTKMADLFVIYGELLTEVIRRRMEAFYLDDLSYSEISANEGVSRSAVYDSIHEGNSQLLGFEEKLHLQERLVKMREIVSALEKETDEERREILLEKLKGEIEYGI